MELQDKPLDPQESLQIIQKFISSARYNLRRFAFAIIFWGVLIPLAALTQYALIQFTNFQMDWLPWAILMPVGFIFTSIYFVHWGKRKGAVPAKAFFFQWLFIWGGFTYFLFAFLSIKLQVIPIAFMLALTSLLIGVSGLVLRYMPLLWGGILFFISAIVCVFIDPLNQLLLMAVSLVIGYLLPGILLTRKEEK